MSALLQVLLVKAVLATVLALVAWLVTRLVHRPALAHSLWLLVLLALVGPPLLRVELLPAGPPAAPVAMAVAMPVASPAPISLVPLALALWLAGAGSILLLGLARELRLRRQLAAAREAPAALSARVLELSREMGLARCPRVRLVAGRLSPMLRGRPGAAEILLPEALLARLADAELDALIAHELAHFRRRDHWVRIVELAATSLFWWHPAVWWARGQLRRLEEICCDSLVLAALPGRARDYARGLVRTMEFLAAAEPAPALATGINGSPLWKERLTMILESSLPASVSSSRWQKALVAVLGAALLFVLPIRAERGVESEPVPLEETQARLADLDREAQELELRLERVRAERELLAAGLPGDELHALAKRKALEELAQSINRRTRGAAEAVDLERVRAAQQAELEAAIADAQARGEAVHAAELQRALELSLVKSDIAAARMAFERAAVQAELERRGTELVKLKLELERLEQERQDTAR